MAVTFEADPVVKLGKPENLFKFSGLYMTPDSSHDGKRFLVTKLAQTTDGQSAYGESASPVPRKINIVLNWFEELEERVPTN